MQQILDIGAVERVDERSQINLQNKGFASGNAKNCQAGQGKLIDFSSHCMTNMTIFTPFAGDHFVSVCLKGWHRNCGVGQREICEG